MKLLLVLLACVAAANAFSYSYQHYCAYNFQVFPHTRCYQYTVYWPSTWCSSSYYAPILKVYPGDDCGTSGFKERTPEEIVAEMKNLLNAALTKMTNEMYAKRNAWLAQIDSIHAEYKSYYKKYIYMFYAYKYRCGIYVGGSYYKIRDDRITAYCAQLDKTRNEILAKFNAAIAEKITALKKYHADILKQGYDCLNTRVKKIEEYRTNVIKKVRDGIAKFTKLHLAILEKKKTYYHDSLFFTIGKCADFWTFLKGAVSVGLFTSIERTKVENLVRVYALKLASHYKKLLQYYTCAYRCYMYSGSIQFFKKSYYQQCRTIGTWCNYKTNYCASKFTVHPFTFTYKSCVYKNLKTCDVSEDSKNAAKVIADLQKKRDETIKANDSKFYSWKSTWVGYNLKYKAEFERIVKERHSWYCAYRYRYYVSSYGYCSSVQLSIIAKLKSDLKKQAEEVCAKFYSNLIAKIIECSNKHAQIQAAFKKTFNDLISKLQAKYNECDAKKKTAIVEYEKKVKAQRDALKAKLVETIYKVRDSHLALFKKMLAHYYGTNYTQYNLITWMYNCYCNRIYKKISDIIHQFDCYWDPLISKLVHHFTCNYRCRIAGCVAPSYYCGAYYSWTYKLPTIYSYSYQLSCYRTYRH